MVNEPSLRVRLVLQGESETKTYLAFSASRVQRLVGVAAEDVRRLRVDRPGQRRGQEVVRRGRQVGGRPLGLLGLQVVAEHVAVVRDPGQGQRHQRLEEGLDEGLAEVPAEGLAERLAEGLGERGGRVGELRGGQRAAQQQRYLPAQKTV